MPHRRRDHTISLRALNNTRGITLVIVLVLISILTVLGSTAVKMTTTDLTVGGTYKVTQAAFYQAEAGLAYTKSQLSALIDEGTLTLNGDHEIESHRFPIPPGFTFLIDEQDTFTRISDTRKYVLQIRGRPFAQSPIQRTIEVVMHRQTALPYGVFGGEQVDLPSMGTITHYRPPLNAQTPIASASNIAIGSNGEVSAQSSHLALDIQGSITLGRQPNGEDARFTFREPSPDVEPAPTTIEVGDGHQLTLLNAGPLNADPLDIDALIEAVETELSVENDNTNIAEISNGSLAGSATFTAGRYHLKALALESGSSLEFDARDGDIRIFTESLTLVDAVNVTAHTEGQGTVTIYLDGPAQFGTPSGSDQPTLTTTGPPSRFRIFSRSDDPITFYHKGDFAAFVYAPKAHLLLSHSTAIGYGLVWAKSVAFYSPDKPVTFYVDPAIQHLFLSNQMEVLSWKELRD